VSNCSEGIGSLLEVGTGFHPELTGRENIYLNGAVLGMKKVEINGKFDEIVAFSNIEKFIDTTRQGTTRRECTTRLAFCSSRPPLSPKSY
jgi:ABC-type polysaccharide/polyol phosphate transport system ATPase subunit